MGHMVTIILFRHPRLAIPADGEAKILDFPTAIGAACGVALAVFRGIWCLGHIGLCCCTDDHDARAEPSGWMTSQASQDAGGFTRLAKDKNHRDLVGVQSS